LLTYLLHTTHAARLGSRAGLGITLIQYGFALRRTDNNWDESTGGTGEEVFGNPPAPAMPTFATAKEQEDYMRQQNVTFPLLGDGATQFGGPTTLFGSEAAAEWLAFFLMTIGWFILLTSVLGFWRVKRWERSMLAAPPVASGPPSAPAPARSRFDSLLAFPGLSAMRGRSILAQGLVPRTPQDHYAFDIGMEYASPVTARTDEGEGERRAQPGHTQFVIDEEDPERAERVAQALVAEQRLNMDLRAAGLL
jgi:hypothetical protein